MLFLLLLPSEILVSPFLQKTTHLTIYICIRLKHPNLKSLKTNIMKKLIVLSAVLFATLNLTSCDKKADTKTEVETEVTTETVDTLATTEADAPVEGATVTEAATVTTTEVK